MKNFVLVLIASFLIIMVFQVVFLVKHEAAHAQVYAKFGIPHEVHYEPLTLSGYTLPYVNQSDPAMVSRYKETIHYNLLIEIEGYHAELISFSVLIGAIIIALAISMREIDGRKN